MVGALALLAEEGGEAAAAAAKAAPNWFVEHAFLIPLFLFGLAITRWTAHGNLPWDVAIAGLLCTAGIAAAYLRRQPGVIEQKKEFFQPEGVVIDPCGDKPCVSKQRDEFDY